MASNQDSSSSISRKRDRSDSSSSSSSSESDVETTKKVKTAETVDDDTRMRDIHSGAGASVQAEASTEASNSVTLEDLLNTMSLNDKPDDNETSITEEHNIREEQENLSRIAYGYQVVNYVERLNTFSPDEEHSEEAVRDFVNKFKATGHVSVEVEPTEKQIEKMGEEYADTVSYINLLLDLYERYDGLYIDAAAKWNKMFRFMFDVLKEEE
ncbi:hypothetical protein F5884DRAFT_852944 [Xylogone sp. PMI_703]|nr:hypothetical protein F5884DRAFT_852944 [Xylogone sp. PMI_703]